MIYYFRNRYRSSPSLPLSKSVSYRLTSQCDENGFGSLLGCTGFRVYGVLYGVLPVALWRALFPVLIAPTNRRLQRDGIGDNTPDCFGTTAIFAPWGMLF